MKKVIFIVMAIAALGFASCGNNAGTATENDSTTVADTVVADSLVADTTVA